MGGSDDGQCCGDGRWSGKQWSELYGDGSRAEHYQFERSEGRRVGKGDDCGSELWSDARDEHGEVQRDGSGSDELECDEHSSGSTGGSEDGRSCGDGGWRGKQWSGHYGDGSRAEHYQFESDVGIGGRFGDDRGGE